MLKKVIVCSFAAALLAASTASATLNVIWSGVDGFYRSDASTPLLDPQGSGVSALYQLIFTTVNGYSPAGVGATVGATETVLATFVNVEAGDGSNTYGELPAQSYSGPFSAGFVYVRVFDQGTSAGGVGVVNGTWYYNSPLYAAVDSADPDTTQSVNAQGGNTIGGFGDALNLQVPEPASLALMSLGGLALAIRRRIKA